MDSTQQKPYLLGYGDRVKSKIIGTPRMLGDLDNPNTDRIIGDNDWRIKPLEEALEYVGLAKPTEKIVGGVKDHFWEDYLDSDDFLQEFLGDSLDKNKLKGQRKKNSKFQGKLIELESLHARYISTIYQDLEELSDELSVAPDRVIAKSRRAKLRDRGGAEVARRLRDKDFKEINLKEGTETAVLVTGGFSGAKGRSGATFAKQLNGLVEDGKTQYVGVRNPFTDVLDADDVRNPDSTKSIPKILDMFAKTHEIGYNPDAAEIAAQAVDLLAKNPQLKLKIAGYSGGGYVAEDVIELLKSQGADMKRVEVMGVGTPQLPGGIKNRDFKKIMGAQDPVMATQQLKQLNNQVRDILGFDIFPELMTKLQNIEGIDNHDLDTYVANSQEVQDFFYGHIPDSKELIDNYAQINSLQKNTSDLTQEMTAVQDDDSLDSAQKLKKLHDIKEQYINLLRQIHTLAKYSESIGGGKFFKTEREVSALELEDAGIIVDPIRVQVNNDFEDSEQDQEDFWQENTPEEQEVIKARSLALALEYKKYLQGLIRSTRDDRGVVSQVIARNFAASDPAKQKELLTFIKQNFSAKAKAYRQAVKAGQLELAKEQGEELVKLAESIKTFYGELNQFDQLDPEVKGMFSSYSGYISSVQNEVVSGTGGKGRINEGLPDIFRSALEYESSYSKRDRENQLNTAEQDGEDFAEGFINGIVETLLDVREAGADIIDEAEQGIREQGEIQSPSRLAQRLGRWFAQGFGVGMAAENMEARGREVVNDAAEGIKQEVATAFDPDNIASLLDTGGAGVIKKIGLMLFSASQNEALDRSLDVIGQLAGKVFRLFITFKLLKVGLDALGLGKLVEAFQNLPEKALDAAIAVESLDNRIIQMSGSAYSGAKNLAFITEEAGRLNRNLTQAKENYSQLLGSTRDTPLEGFQTENIYTAFASTAKAKALSAESEQELFRSVRSIIGKNILSQEEVRQEIGEKLGDFEKSLAEAYGVSIPQLNKMISNREVVATEALPKVAAVLRSKNEIAGDLDTGAAAAQRADNAVLSFQQSVGNVLLPLQKVGNNFLAGFFDNIAQTITTIQPLVNGFFVALTVNLFRVQILGQSLQKVLLGLVKVLWTLKGALFIFAAEIALISAAWAAWSTVIDQLSDRFFPQINKDLDQITRGMEAYRKAIDEARGAQEDLGSTKLRLNEGADLSGLPDWIQGLAGGDRLNFDNLIRDRVNNAYGGYQDFVAKITGTKSSNIRVFKTARENKEEQLEIDNSNLILKGYQLNSQSSEAFKAAEKITQYDLQIAEIQSSRLKLRRGDQEGLKASLAQEQEINKERDKELKILTSYQQTQTAAVGIYQARLEDLEALYLGKEINQDTYDSKKANLEGLLGDSEKILKGLNDQISKVSTKLSQFARNLQNSSERVEGFLSTADRQLQQDKAAIIEQGILSGKGNQTIQTELEFVQQRDLQRRIDFIKKELSNLESELQSPELDPAVKRIKANLAQKNIELNETSLNKIIEDSTVQADKEAAQGLINQLQRSTQLSGLTEQLAQSIQSNRNALIDFNRTIQDYFFKINQQIQEAQIEVLRIVEQIVQTQIRNKLQSALSPNAESFVNSLISSTQSMLDQAASYADKVLGQRGARIQFAGQKRTLEMELQDFARNVSGASEALAEFEGRLRGGGSVGAFHGTPVQGSNSFASKTKEVALRLGIDPHALMTIMLFESAGTLDPEIRGPQVGSDPNNKGRGLIQFMPATARGLGTSDAALAAMSQLEQLDYVEKYFAQFKGNFGAGKLENLYAAVLAGDPRKVNASDGYTTAREGAQKMISQYGKKATSLLGATDTSTEVLQVPKPPNSASVSEYTSLPPAPPEIQQATQETEFLIGKEEQKLDLQDSLIQNQEKESLEINLDNTFKSDRRRVETEIKQRQFGMDDAVAAQLDLLSQYDYQTADTEGAKAIRDVNKAFSDRFSEVLRQIQFYSDEIASIEKIIAQTPSLRASAKTEEERSIIYEQEANAKLLLPVYQENLGGFVAQEQELNNSADKALGFIRDQNRLKKEQEDIVRRSLILNQKDGLAQARGGVEDRRRIKVELENARLEDEINKIRQNTPEGYDRNEQILNAQRQSKINKENIEYDAIAEELALEKKLLDYESQIGSAKAGFLSRIGFNFGASKIQRDNAIKQENDRFISELLELEKSLKGQPDKLAEMKKKAQELNAVNLEAITQQFKSLRQTVEDSFISSTQGFFTQFTTNFFDGKTESDRAQLEERLRYAEEVVGLENQYREEPGKLAHLKNRARELNEQKLSNISQEFNIFGRAVNLAKQALLEFIKQMAQLAAQQAAAKFISSIIEVGSNAFGGGKNFDGVKLNKAPKKVKAFKADKGATVGDRNVGKGLTNWLRNNSPGVAQAWNAEGEGAQLGVFHTGEELLSRKTGEAGRYQALKRMYGFNPLDKIGVFKDGGTVGDNILATMPPIRSPRLDLSGIGQVRGQRSGVSKTVNVHTTVVTPNADSFRLNQDQLYLDLVERIRRGI